VTTGLVSGMSLEKACATVAARAEQLRAETDAPLSVWTETGRQSVLVGIARRGMAATTMLVPRAEYDGIKLFERLVAETPGGPA